jgi:hypothetical protein
MSEVIIGRGPVKLQKEKPMSEILVELQIFSGIGFCKLLYATDKMDNIGSAAIFWGIVPLSRLEYK